MTEATTRTVESGLEWFGSGLPASAREVLADLGRVECYVPGAEVFREGEESRDFGIILSGRIALRVLVPERGQVTILTCEPDDIINWSAIVPPYRSTSTGIAIERVEVLTFDGAALRGALRSNPELAAAVSPRVLRAVARRIRGLGDPRVHPPRPFRQGLGERSLRRLRAPRGRGGARSRGAAALRSEVPLGAHPHVRVRRRA